MAERLDWHRIFGLMLTDYFHGTGYTVEMEMDLSLKRQLLDVVVVRCGGNGKLVDVCDGFDDLGPHNLITYKSMRESLTEWSLDELIGHYVNYRKRLGLSTVRPEDVRLYAASTRFPKDIAGRFQLAKVKDGVFDLDYGSRRIRVIVLPNIGEATGNAIWELLSADRHKVEDGVRRYRFHIDDLSSIVNEIFANYKLEGLDMPYNVEQYKKDYMRRELKKMPPEEVLSMYKPEERIAGLKPKQRLAGLKPKERLAGLKPEEVLDQYSSEEVLGRYSPEEVLGRYSPEFISQWLSSQKKKPGNRSK